MAFGFQEDYLTPFATGGLKMNLPRLAGFGQPTQTPELTPEEEKSWLKRLGSTATSGISTVGNLLDVPGSMARDVVGGLVTGDWAKHNPVDQLLTPFSPENRTTGQD